MKKFAALAVVGGLAVGAASLAQPPVLSFPTVPPQAALDRLNLQLGWRTRVPTLGARDGIATVQNFGDVLIVQTRSGAISALDPVNGATRWRAVFGEPYPVVHQVGANDQFILAATGTRVYALDRATGQRLWDVNLPSTPSSPPAADDTAFYVNLSNGRTAAYAFPHELPPPPGATPPPGSPGGPAQVSPGQPAGSPAPTGRPGTAKVEAPRPTTVSQGPGGTGRTVRFSGALDTRTGTVAAQASVAPGYGLRMGAGGGIDINATRSASGGGNINASRTATGGGDINRTARGSIEVTNAPQLLWFFQTNLRVWQRPMLGQNSLLVISSGPTALFLDKARGDRPSDYQSDAAFTAPAAQYGETVYLGAQDGSVYAVFLPSRVVLWRYTASSIVTAVPVATDEDIYIDTDLGGLTRIDRTTGQEIWKNPAARHFLATNLKVVYASDREGKLMVLDRARGRSLTALDMRDYVVPVSNERTDRVFMAANDGTLISLHDKSYPQPLRTQNPANAPAPPTPGTVPAAPAGAPAAPVPGSTTQEK
jgi:outer membrane protein assembly factor BamB